MSVSDIFFQNIFEILFFKFVISVLTWSVTFFVEQKSLVFYKIKFIILALHFIPLG